MPEKPGRAKLSSVAKGGGSRSPYRKSLLAILLPRLSASSPPQKSSSSRPAFQAVSIQRGAEACEAAKLLGSRRFLANKAPSLPLPGCGKAHQCRCRYVKYPDRRSEPRRLMDVGLSSMVFDSGERRSRKGRRSTD